MSLDAATQARLVGLFVAEAEEALRVLGTAHGRLASTAAGEDLQVFGRTAHGLKGASAALGFRELARALHDLEEVSLGLAAADGPDRKQRHQRLAVALRLLEQGVAQMAASGRSSYPAEVAAAVAGALAGPKDGGAGPARTGSEAPAPVPAGAPSSVPELVAERLSVPAADVDEAMRLAASLARATAQLQGAMAGSEGPLVGAALGLAARAERLEAIIAGLRLLPADVALSGLEDEVEALAHRLGKEVVLAVEGREVRADRRTLQAARATLRHLVRNAVDHGIEAPADRRAAGKLAAGTLSLRVTSIDGTLQVTVADDGAGFDVAAAREALVRRGDEAEEVLRLPEPEVLARFAAAGGSTRQQVTEVSGRGMGLSAVAALARDAGGTLSVRSERGRGSAVTFSLPLDVYSIEALVAWAGDQALGIPVQALERTVLLHDAGEAVQVTPTGRTLATGESIVPLIGLSEAVGLEARPGGEHFALVLHGPDGTVALAADDIGAVVAVVPVPVPGAAGAGALVTGLARLADGTTLQVVDPRSLVAAARIAARRPRPLAAAPAAILPAQAPSAGPSAAPSVRRPAEREVVLAEDSLATREVLRVLLEEQGFRVRLAADGEEALARIRERMPDVLVTDVNMPRRDGLSLTRALRADPATAGLPVILLTSQDDEATREAGASAGADAYLVKSRFGAGVLASTLERIGLGIGPMTRLSAVVDDYALAALPGLDRDLAQAGVSVLRCFDRLPSPAMLRRPPHGPGVAIIGGRDLQALRARLETATATLSAPVVASLPPGEAALPELRGPGVVDLIPAGTRGAAERVVLMSRVPIVSAGLRRAAPARVSPPWVAPGPAMPPIAAGRPPERVLAIASSTGGVWVLAGLLQAYRPRGETAVLLAQHMDAEFVTFFADWLASTTPWVTVLVEESATLEAGRLYLASGGRDLVADAGQVKAVAAQSRYVPCADRLFRSVAAAHGARARAVVLSGMGADGAEGLAEVARRGGRVVCQAPESAVVASMPESALRCSPGAERAAPELLAEVLGRA